MTNPIPTRRRFFFTPAWLTFGLLVVEGLLWLSERLQWFPFNHHKGWTVLIAVAVVGLAMLVMLGWLIVALVLRWRFQFSIRSLLVLVVVFALPFSWLAVEMKAAREQAEVVEKITKPRGSVSYDWQVDASGTFLPDAKPSGPERLRNLLGQDFFGAVVQAIVNNRNFTDAGLAHLAGLTQLQVLHLDGTEITDSGLAHLEGLKQLTCLLLGNSEITDSGLAHLAGLHQLQTLWLNDTKITDAGLAHLAGLTQLQDLDLSNTQITDAGLAHLAGLTQLQDLDLSNTQITDAGLEHLSGLETLQRLDLSGTKVTDEGVKKLQQALPNCKIIR